MQVFPHKTHDWYMSIFSENDKIINLISECYSIPFCTTKENPMNDVFTNGEIMSL